MHSIPNDMVELRRQLEKGAVRRGYRALLSYLMGLRTHFKTSYPDYAVSSLYQGYMDMAYFAVFTPALESRHLKTAIVFNFETFGFEAWLAGKNRKVGRRYWELFKDSRWTGYRVVKPGKGVDSIVECDLAQDVDLSDPAALTRGIETATVAFIADIERYLEEHPSR